MRRTISDQITTSGSFLRMPLETQALYFHLCLAADDDGVVEAFKIMKITDAKEDSLRVLDAKGFIKVLNEDLLAYIRDWNIHDNLRLDRKRDTIYIQLLKEHNLYNENRKAKTRADVIQKRISTSVGRPVDVQWTHQDKISKDKISKDKINKIKKINKKEIEITAGQSYSETQSKHQPASKQDTQKYVDYINSVKQSKFRVTDSLVPAYRRLLKTYSKPEIKQAIQNMANDDFWRKHLTPAWLCKPSNIEKALNMESKSEPEKDKWY